MTTETKKEFKLTLKFSAMPDSPKYRAAIKKLDTFPLWRDSKARIISHEEYIQLIEEGAIAPGVSYWKINEDQVGIVCETYYATQWSNTWEQISNCYRDFMDGWDACEKGYQMLRDWDEALAHEAARNAWDKIMRRKFTIDVTDEKNVSYWDIDELPRYIEGIITSRLTTRRNGKAWITVECKCTGEGMWPIMEQIGNRTGYWNHQVPENPKHLECHKSYGWPLGKKFSKSKKS